MDQTLNEHQAGNALGADYTQRSKKFGLFVVIGLVVFWLLTGSISATSISEGFSSDQTFPVGTVLSISKDNPNLVELANTSNAEYVTGVAADATDGALTLTDSTANTFVAVNGDSQVLVSDINGPIEEGDLLGPSPISGVAQKVTVSEGGRVLGVALSAFDGTTGKTETVGGKEVKISILPMRILLTEISGNTPSPLSFIEKLGVAVTGSEVSTVRVIISSIAFFVALFISSLMLFGSIKGTFASIGRNPLASESIFSNLMHVTLVAATVLVIGIVTAYLVMAI